MPFPPQQDHRIPLTEAAAMTRRYREGVAKGAETAEMFPREVFEALLKSPKARGIRVYFAREAAGGRLRLVAVGVDENGNDLADGDIFERGFPCPPVCSGGNPLNS